MVDPSLGSLSGPKTSMAIINIKNNSKGPIPNRFIFFLSGCAAGIIQFILTFDIIAEMALS